MNITLSIVDPTTRQSVGLIHVDDSQPVTLPVGSALPFPYPTLPLSQVIAVLGNPIVPSSGIGASSVALLYQDRNLLLEYRGPVMGTEWSSVITHGSVSPSPVAPSGSPWAILGWAAAGAVALVAFFKVLE